MTDFMLYCLFVWFWFFLINHAVLLMPLSGWLKDRLPGYVIYSLECPLCFAWWLSAACWSCLDLPGLYVFAAPVVNLFLGLIYDRLSEPPLLK